MTPPRAMLALVACALPGCLLPPLGLATDPTDATVALDATAAGDAAAEACVPTGPTHSGHGVLEAELHTTASHTKASQNTATVPAGSQVRMGVWVRGRGEIRVFLCDGSWSELGAVSCNVTDEAWTLCGSSIATGSATQLILGFQDDFDGDHAVSLDDAFVVPEDGVNRIANPGFEDGMTRWDLSGPDGTTNVFSAVVPAADDASVDCPVQ